MKISNVSGVLGVVVLLLNSSCGYVANLDDAEAENAGDSGSDVSASSGGTGMGGTAGGSADNTGVGGTMMSTGGTGGGGGTGGTDGSAGSMNVGGSTGGLPQGVDAIVGTWTYTGGTVFLDCGADGSDLEQITSGTVTFAAGAGMTVSLSTDACTFQYDVTTDAAGVTTATGHVGETCNYVSSGFNFSFTVVSSVYTTKDGQTLTANEVVNEVGSDSTLTLKCTGTVNGTLVR